MANTISVSVSMQVSSSGTNVTGSGGFNATGGTGMIGVIQTIGTSAEALDFTDVGTPYAVFLKNMDETNYVDFDAVNTIDAFPQRLLPGECIVLRPSTGTIYGKAHTSACQVFVVAS